MKRLETKQSLIKCHPRSFFHRQVKWFEHKKGKKRDKICTQKTFFATIYKSSRPEVFCKKGVPRNFAKFTGKHLCHSLYSRNISTDVSVFLNQRIFPLVWIFSSKKLLFHGCNTFPFLKKKLGNMAELNTEHLILIKNMKEFFIFNPQEKMICHK